MKNIDRYLQKSLLNRLSIVHWGKTLTIKIIKIIIIIIIIAIICSRCSQVQVFLKICMHEFFILHNHTEWYLHSLLRDQRLSVTVKNSGSGVLLT